MKVIGLISGTSADGIDAALVEITGTKDDLKVDLIAGETFAYSDKLRSHLLSLISNTSLSMAELAALDDDIAQAFGHAALTIQKGHPQAELIGSHGQTVYHRPPNPQAPQTLGYSWQLGRGAVIAHLTGIPTISNFRAADIAAEGQGAPLVPCVDAYLLRDKSHHRCIQNIGGIGNVTYLSCLAENTDHGVLGWDTGPGNSLIDLAVQQFSDGRKLYDRNGEWAAKGTPYQELVKKWLEADFFQQKPPKSTGRELFGQQYLEHCLNDAAVYHLSQADILATLTELTAASIVNSYHNFLPKQPDQVLLCGGGSHNLYLKQRLQILLGETPVLTTNEFGINPDFKEAITFAVLAYWRYHNIPGNLPQVTGANATVLLGEIHPIFKK